MASPSKSTIRRLSLWVVITAALAAALLTALSTVSCSRKPEASQETSGQATQQAGRGSPAEASQPPNSAPKEPGSTLEIGTEQKEPGLVIAVPLEFTSGPHQSVGTIEAELNVKEGPWKFQRAKLPEGSPGKISAKPKRSVGSGGGFVIELEISAGDQEIEDGVAGYLTFSTNDAATSEIPVTVGRLDTFPPGIGPGETEQKSAGGSELPSTPDAAAPAPSCFFFTH
jgi:hypothetical protein